jgi:hypothetical protein
MTLNITLNMTKAPPPSQLCPSTPGMWLRTCQSSNAPHRHTTWNKALRCCCSPSCCQGEGGKTQRHAGKSVTQLPAVNMPCVRNVQLIVVENSGAACRSTKCSTHACPGMHMQQCLAVPLKIENSRGRAERRQWHESMRKPQNGHTYRLQYSPTNLENSRLNSGVCASLQQGHSIHWMLQTH